MNDLIIIGSGPAGYTAAIYAARAELNLLLIGGAVSGGQPMLTTEIENFPGFPEGIMGPQLMANMRKQAERFGTKILDKDVTNVDFSKTPLKVMVGEKTYETRAVIIATGAETRWLGLENEKRLIGKGVAVCATCDGFFYKDKRVVVVGGGNSALEEATFLTKFAKEVIVIHRHKELSATKILADRAKADPKISFEWNKDVIDILGKDRVAGIKVKDRETGEEKEIPTDGIFVAIGRCPTSKLFKDKLETDKHGFIKATEGTKTSIPGVFVAGDVQDPRYRQVVIAAGSGAAAAIDAENFLKE